MKKIISMLCALSLCMASGIAAVRADEEYNYTDSYGNIYTYRIFHNPNSFGAGIINISLSDGADSIVIPSEIDGTDLRSISKDAFKNCKNDIRSITLMGDAKFDFSGFTNLTTVILPDNLNTLEDSCFMGCSSLSNINLPEGLKIIEDSVFSGCTSLKSITIPNSVEDIGNYAFENCTSLETVNWNHNCGIGYSAFIGTAYAKNTDFILTNDDKTLYSAGGNSKTVEIPSTVTKIAQFAFEDSNAEKVIIPESLKVITTNAFYGAKHIKEIEFKGNITKLESAAFQECTSLSKAIIPESISEIPELCFAGCTSIKEIVMPDGVNYIGQNAFQGCTEITDISLPNTLKVIDEFAFEGCLKLKQVTIPKSVETICARAFNRCNSLAELIIEGNTTVKDAAFCQTALTKDNIIIKGKVTYTPIANGKKYQNDAFSFMYGNLSFTEEPADLHRKPRETETPEEMTQKPQTTKTPETTEKTTPVPSAEPEKEKTLTVTKYENGKITIGTDGNLIAFNDAQPFIDENDRTQIPIRAVAEALDCTVSWDEASQTAAIIKGNEVITVTIGSKAIQANGKTITMDTTAQIVDDRTYIPVRFVAEALGMTIDFENKYKR